MDDGLTIDPQKSVYTYSPFKLVYSPIFNILVWTLYDEVMVGQSPSTV